MLVYQRHLDRPCAWSLGGLGRGGWKGAFITSNSGDSATGEILRQAAWSPRRPVLQPWRWLPGHSPRPLTVPSSSPGGLGARKVAWTLLSRSGCPVALPGPTPPGMGEKRPCFVVHLSSPTCVFPRAAPQDATPVPAACPTCHMEVLVLSHSVLPLLLELPLGRHLQVLLSADLEP